MKGCSQLSDRQNLQSLPASPATPLDRKCTSDVCRAQSSHLCRSPHRSCRAGTWSPSRSKAHTAPAGTKEEGTQVVDIEDRSCEHLLVKPFFTKRVAFLHCYWTNALQCIMEDICTKKEEKKRKIPETQKPHLSRVVMGI